MGAALGRDESAAAVRTRSEPLRTGDVDEATAGDEGPRTRAANRRDVVARRADQVAGLDPRGDVARGQVNAEDRHGVGMIRAAEPWHAHALGGHALLRFLRGNAV